MGIVQLRTGSRPRPGRRIGVATDALKTVRGLDALPATADAVVAGELSSEQAGEIVAAALDDPSAESDLLETARSTSLQGLRDEARRVRNGAADDLTKARRLYQGRRLHRWIDRDGAHCGNYCLPPVAARASMPPSTGTWTSCSPRPVVLAGASPVTPTRRTRSWRWPSTAPASRSSCV
jgi:hypothetical protein